VRPSTPDRRSHRPARLLRASGPQRRDPQPRIKKPYTPPAHGSAARPTTAPGEDPGPGSRALDRRRRRRDRPGPRSTWSAALRDPRADLDDRSLRPRERVLLRGDERERRVAAQRATQPGRACVRRGSAV